MFECSEKFACSFELDSNILGTTRTKDPSISLARKKNSFVLQLASQRIFQKGHWNLDIFSSPHALAAVPFFKNF